jgi:hypothetical protein
MTAPGTRDWPLRERVSPGGRASAAAKSSLTCTKGDHRDEGEPLRLDLVAPSRWPVVAHDQGKWSAEGAIDQVVASTGRHRLVEPCEWSVRVVKRDVRWIRAQCQRRSAPSATATESRVAQTIRTRYQVCFTLTIILGSL